MISSTSEVIPVHPLGNRPGVHRLRRKQCHKQNAKKHRYARQQMHLLARTKESRVREVKEEKRPSPEKLIRRSSIDSSRYIDRYTLLSFLFSPMCLLLGKTRSATLDIFLLTDL